METLTLVMGTRNWSSWSLRAWLVMQAAGVPFREHMVALRAEGTAAEIGALSPSGLVPVLLIGPPGAPQLQVWDSLAIAETMAERVPEAGLWPRDAAARAVARAASAEMHSGFAELRRHYPMDFARVRPGLPPSPGTAAAIARITALWSGLRQRFGLEGPYLFGAFSIADCFYAPVVSRFRTYAVPLAGATGAYADAMWAHPAMAAWLSASAAEVAAGLPPA